ncbi:hypothetical protein G3I38_14740 [Streptomyces sp. SID7958]|uniref:Uncharacterized protein n=2 Tax=unclassified Streptomyces TaxID=2593676 RepID=A0A6G3QQF4_9ACTN|nr:MULTISPECIES: hypothetical protein [unclassified Streptomyces]NEA85728.1 hypothetical protein [Streptomyces sp. SID14436]NEC80453.1 hypothetical protein [Streptomyces sp. SID7958]
MRFRGNTLRLTAVSALVVLTLTGFSTGRHRGGDGGGGGGCSSSSQNHDSSPKSGGGYHRDYDDDDDDYDYGSGSSGSDSTGATATSTLTDATVELLSCASKSARHATVRVTNPNPSDGTFTVRVVFEDRAGVRIITGRQQVDVPADDTVTVRVPVGGDAKRAARVAHCEPEPEAPAVR